MSHYQEVQEFEVPTDANYPGFEDQLKTWLAAIRMIPELDQSVRRAFTERREEFSQVAYEDPKCLVIETALLFCHKRGIKRFFVRELAEKVNDLLLGRHADFSVEDRMAGSILHRLGVRKRRVTKGFCVDLTPSTRTQIHRLAVAYQVLSARGDVQRCEQCKNENLSV
jgi:hypothetical protein